jgi:uncharacterized membrane-anchored protein
MRLGVKETLLLGLGLREAFSFWTGHPFDFELWVRLGYQVFHGADPYTYIKPAPGLTFANVFSAESGPVIGYLPFWPFLTALLYGVYSVVGFGNRFVYYFLLKQPTILGDLLLAYLIYRYVLKRRPDKAVFALRVWIFLPFTIIVSSIWGMFDSIAMVFVLLALATTGYTARSVWSGLGTFAKSIPGIYILPLTLRNRRKWWGAGLAIGIPALMTLGTVVYQGWTFIAVGNTLASTSLKGGESMSFFDIFFYLNSLNLLPASLDPWLEPIGLLWVPAVLIAVAWSLRKFGTGEDEGVLQSLLVVTLVFLIFKSQVNEQYAIYLISLSLVDYAVWNRDRGRVFAYTVVVATAFLLVNNIFLIRFVSPSLPDAASIDFALAQQLGGIRLGIKFLLGSAFTVLNLLYLRRIATDKPTSP